MSVFTTLHIAHCMQTLLHSAHTRIFARWFTTGAASTYYITLPAHFIWFMGPGGAGPGVLLHLHLYILHNVSHHRETAEDGYLYNSQWETRYPASHSMPTRAAWPVAADLSSYLLCPADSWPPAIQHDLSILAECQGHCPVMWGHVHQRLWLWCYVWQVISYFFRQGLFLYTKNQGTKAILLSKILHLLFFR